MLPIPQKHSNTMLILVWGKLFFFYAKHNTAFKGNTSDKPVICIHLDGDTIREKASSKNTQGMNLCRFSHWCCRSKCHYISLGWLKTYWSPNRFCILNCNNHDYISLCRESCLVLLRKCLSAINQHPSKRGFKTIQQHSCSSFFPSNYFWHVLVVSRSSSSNYWARSRAQQILSVRQLFNILVTNSPLYARCNLINSWAKKWIDCVFIANMQQCTICSKR